MSFTFSCTLYEFFGWSIGIIGSSGDVLRKVHEHDRVIPGLERHHNPLFCFSHLKLLYFKDFLVWNEFRGRQMLASDVQFGAFPTRFNKHQIKQK
jgi:hypothetical protein